MTPIIEPPEPADATRAGPQPRVRLGDELPVFCEKCGYSLHGLPQVRCGHCDILHFACPECGHHQPINTLRPAAHRILGRVRAALLAASVTFRILFFVFVLMGWFAMGTEWSYTYNYSGLQPGRRPVQVPAPLSEEMVWGFCVFGVLFGMVARMMLLRWRRGWRVGVILAAVVAAIVLAGARAARFDRNVIPDPPGAGFLLAVTIGMAFLVLGAAVVWPLWVGVARLFLPKATADAMLDWQRGRVEAESSLAR